MVKLPGVKTSNVDEDTPELAQYYDRVSDFQYEVGQALIEMLKIKEGDSVLDVGCGTGRMALRAAKAAGASGKVFGVDPSLHRIFVAIDNLAALNAHNVTFDLGTAEELFGFDDESMDTIYYCAVFHWVEDKQAALEEAYRVLKPGGKVGITTGSRDQTFSYSVLRKKILSEYPGAAQAQEKPTNGRWVTEEELRGMLGRAGFTDVAASTSTIKSYFNTPKDVLRFLRASAFGQTSGVPQGLRQEYVRRISVELEKLRTPKGIEVTWNPLFLTATKPGHRAPAAPRNLP